MAWCGCSRKARQCRASSGGGAAGWSVSTSTPYIPWQRRSSKALRPFFGGMYGWVFCAKSWQLGVHFELVKDVQGNLPLRGRILGGPIRPEELPHLMMIRLQHSNGIFWAAPCCVPRCHSILLSLLAACLALRGTRPHCALGVASTASLMPWSFGGIRGGSVRGRHTYHVCFWGIFERVGGVSQKTLVSFADLLKIRTLTPLKSQKKGGF